MPHAAPSRDIVVVHSSDLHIDHDYTARLHGGDGTAGLSGVLSAARAAGADVVVLAGRVPWCRTRSITTARWPRSKIFTCSASPTRRPSCSRIWAWRFGAVRTATTAT